MKGAGEEGSRWVRCSRYFRAIPTCSAARCDGSRTMSSCGKRSGCRTLMDSGTTRATMSSLVSARAGRLRDDHDTEARAVGRALAQAIRDLETWSREAGASKPSTLNFVATNGRVLAATRRGRPLHYGLFEGIMPCKREGIGPQTPESDPRVRAHRQVKAVCFATNLKTPNGFLEVPEASVVAVSRTLQVGVSSLAN